MTEKTEPIDIRANETAPSPELDHEPSIVLGFDFTQLNESELRIVPDALKKLPEELQFVPGINLIVGHNAQGKSTLLEAMWGALIAYAKGVTVDEARNTIADDVKQIKLNLSLSTAKALKVKGIKPFAGFTHFDYTESPVENARASGGFGAAMATTTYHTKSQRESREARFRQSGASKINQSEPSLLLLDEPEHGLDPWRHQNIEGMIKELASSESTIIVATNSPILVADAELPRIDLRFPEDGLTYLVR
jgi:predicted ATPase